MTQAIQSPLTLLPMGKQYLTVRQAAELLMVSTETVRQWFHAGVIPGIRIGKGIRLRADAVTALLNGGEA